MAVFACLEGFGSPSQWEKLAHESEPMQWLIRGMRPCRTACYNFRDRLGPLIENLVTQSVTNAMNEGLVDPKIGVQDGTDIRALASRHRLVNSETLKKRQALISQVIREDSESISGAERPKWMAKTPGGRLDQQQRMTKAEEVLAGRLKENASRRKDRRLREKHVRVSISEPEAPLGRDKENVFCALYTPQFVVEPNSLLILTYDVFLQNTDAGTLPKMLDKTKEAIGRHLEKMLADSAYRTILDLIACKQRGVELIASEKDSEERKGKKPTKIDKSKFTWLNEEQTYLCPEGHKLEYRSTEHVRRREGETLVELRFQCSPEYCIGCPLRSECVTNPEKGRIVKRLEGQEILDAHSQEMKTAEAKELYKLRGQVIERAFADVKQHRKARRFHGRGIARAKTELGLMVLAQNFLSIMRLRKNRENPVVQAA